MASMLPSMSVETSEKGVALMIVFVYLSFSFAVLVHDFQALQMAQPITYAEMGFFA